MGVKVDIKLDKGKINKLTNAYILAAKATAEQLRHEVISEQVIPFDEGTLQNVQTYVDPSKAAKGLIQIVHKTPYAGRVYFNPQFNFQTTHNANARGEWWTPWLEGNKKLRPKQIFRVMYKKYGGV